MRTIVYVDGFNLYYGALRKTPYRWLNLQQLCQRLLLPKNKITEIKYFTALVSDRPNDPFQSFRQQTYLRALATLPHVSVHLGHFLVHEVDMPLAQAIDGRAFARVIKTEEKGSDVNLASHLLHDAHLDRFDVAVVISNDSDLLFPIRLVRSDLRKQVGLLNPHKRPSGVLVQNADFIKQIRKGVLADSQFPDTLEDERGRFDKPRSW